MSAQSCYEMTYVWKVESGGLLQGYLPPFLPTTSPLLVFFFLFFGPVTLHFCNLNVQMLCSHGPVAGLISDPWSGRWLICCWFQLQKIVPPIIFAQAAT